MSMLKRKGNKENASRKVHRSNPQGKIFVTNMRREKTNGESLSKGKQRKQSLWDPRGLGESAVFTCFGFKLGKTKGGHFQRRSSLWVRIFCHFVGGFGDSDRSPCRLAPPYPWNVENTPRLEINCFFLSWIWDKNKNNNNVSLFLLSPVSLFFYYLAVMTALLTEKCLKL